MLSAEVKNCLHRKKFLNVLSVGFTAGKPESKEWCCLARQLQLFVLNNYLCQALLETVWTCQTGAEMAAAECYTPSRIPETHAGLLDSESKCWHRFKQTHQSHWDFTQGKETNVQTVSLYQQDTTTDVFVLLYCKAVGEHRIRPLYRSGI